MKHHIVELDDYEHSSNSEPVRLTPHLIVDGRQEGFIRSLQNGCQVYEEQGACSDIHGADLLGHSSLRRLLNFPAHHATIADPIAIHIPQKQKPFNQSSECKTGEAAQRSSSSSFIIFLILMKGSEMLRPNVDDEQELLKRPQRRIPRSHHLLKLKSYAHMKRGKVLVLR